MPFILLYLGFKKLKMKQMKTILCVSIFFIGLINYNSLNAQTQASDRSTNAIDNQNSFYIKALELKEDQALKFIDINSNYERQVDALKSESKRKGYKEKLKALEEERDRQLEELLSKKQFKNYIELRREKRKNLQGLIRKQP